MTSEQRILVQMARENTRTALQQLERGMIGLTQAHLQQAISNLKQFQAAGGVGVVIEPPARIVELETIQPTGA